MNDEKKELHFLMTKDEMEELPFIERKDVFHKILCEIIAYDTFCYEYCVFALKTSFHEYHIDDDAQLYQFIERYCCMFSSTRCKCPTRDVREEVVYLDPDFHEDVVKMRRAKCDDVSILNRFMHIKYSYGYWKCVKLDKDERCQL